MAQSLNRGVWGTHGRIDSEAAAWYDSIMKSIRYTYWQDGNMWLGYLEEFPDYLTQGESLDELRENLRDLYQDLTSGVVPGVRRVAEMQLA
jgi:hypothetical protein